MISGKDFNKKYHNTNFIKLTNKEGIHNKFEFKEGLNIDFITFNPYGECEPGGIYFCEFDKSGEWINYNNVIGVMYYYYEVIIPDDAQLYEEKNKFKSDKLILINKQVIFETEKLCEIAVKYHASNIQYVPYQLRSETLCEIVVKYRGSNLQYVPEHFRNETLCEIAVKDDGYNLQYVPDHLQTEKLCEIAVKDVGSNLQFFYS